MSRSTITRIGQGVFAQPTPESLRAIAKAIEMPYGELFAIAGWIPSISTRRDPHVHISYHDIPEQAIQEIEAAVDAVAARHGMCFRPDCASGHHQHTVLPPDDFIPE